MKSTIIAVALFVFTVIGVVLYPPSQGIGAITKQLVDPVIDLPLADPLTNERSQIEVVFVLDTTGSMGGLIQAAKEKIWSIASTMAQAEPAPEIKMGLVAYRDRGDDYITRVVDLSDDLDSMYAALMDFQALGGGDGPESVNQALYDAVHTVSWSQDPNAYKVVFLVGDAPPHMDYQDDVKYTDSVAAAGKRGIVINSIQCGQNDLTTQNWQKIAQLGSGRYFQVDQAGSAVAMATPLDTKIAELSEDLDATRLYYGTVEEKQKQRLKADATDKLHKSSSVESRARRATFNVSKGGEANFLGEGELVDDVASGRVDLSTIAPEHLPKSIQALAPAQQRALITETADRRKELQRQIKGLAEKRSGLLKEKVEKLGGAKDSLDHKIFSAVREQAEKKGLRYEVNAPDY